MSSWKDFIRKEKTVETNSFNSLMLPTLNDLYIHYNAHCSNRPLSGSFNNTYICTNHEHKSIAFRVSRLPFLKVPKTQSNRQSYFSSSSKSDKGTIKLLNLLEQTKNNWLDANKRKICPEIYFYGYIMIGNGVHSCIVSEAYQMNLHDFYAQLPNSLNSIDLDVTVCSQLIKLINNLVKLRLICGDIKPANCVINFERNSINQINKVDVRIIDLDGDYCKEYQGLLLKRETDTSQNGNIKLMLCIIMANHFLYYLNNNIFATYFNTGNIREKIESLKTLFLNHEKFDFMERSKHYFIRRMKTESGVIVDKEIDFTRLFDVMIENITRYHIENRVKENTENEEPNTSLPHKKRRTGGKHKTFKNRKINGSKKRFSRTNSKYPRKKR